MWRAGQTVLVGKIGIATVGRVLPSGASLVRDCLGYWWLVATAGPPAELVGGSVFAANAKGGRVNAKRLGLRGKGR